MKKLLHKVVLSLLIAMGVGLNAQGALVISDIIWPKDNQVLADNTGKALFKVSFNVTNDGDAAVNPGDDGYRFVVGNINILGTVLTKVGEKDGDQILNPQETTTVEIDCEYRLDDPDVDKTLGLKILECVDNATFPAFNNNVKFLSPAAVIEVKTDGSSGKLAENDVVDYGVYELEKTVDFVIGNTGRSPLVVSAIDFAAGLAGASTNVGFPFEVAVGETVTVPVKIAGDPGGKQGVMTIRYNNAVSDKEFLLVAKAGVMARDTWSEDFQAVVQPSLPDGWYNEPGSDGNTHWETRMISGEDNVYARQTAANYPSSVVTPLLSVKDGDKLSLQVGLENTTYNHGAFVVKYSTDRESWTELGKIEQQDGNGRLPTNTFNWIASGNYGLDWYNFTLKNLPAGNYYFSFEGAYCMIDNVFGLSLAEVDHDMMIGDLKVPAFGMVNNAVAVSVPLKNFLGKPDCDYAVTLSVDGMEVANGDPVEIPAYGEAAVVLNYIPAVEGLSSLKVNVTVGDVVLSAAAELNVVAESPDLDAQVGEIEKLGSDEPYYPGNKFTHLQSILTESEIGLPAGSRIVKMSVIGYSTRYNVYEENIRICLESTDKESFTSDEKEIVLPGETADVYVNDKYKFEAKGSSADLQHYEFEFPEPYVYDGGNLMLTMVKEMSSSNFGLNLAYHEDMTADRSRVKSWNTTSFILAEKVCKAVPTVIFTVERDVYCTVGQVKDDGQPVEGATVTLRCRVLPDGEAASFVVYSGVTDGDGRFSIPVIQSGKKYDVTVTVDGDGSYSFDPVEVADDKDTDLGVLALGTTGIGEIGASAGYSVSVDGNVVTICADQSVANVYSIDGRKVVSETVDGSRFVELPAGLYVVDLVGSYGRKIVKISVL